MSHEKTAVLLIGYQNDYFSDEGILHGVIEVSRKEVLAKTLKLRAQALVRPGVGPGA